MAISHSTWKTDGLYKVLYLVTFLAYISSIALISHVMAWCDVMTRFMCTVRMFRKIATNILKLEFNLGEREPLL